VRGELVIPLHLAGGRIEREDTIGEQVIAAALAVVRIGPGIAGRPEEGVGGRVVGTGEPRGAAT